MSDRPVIRNGMPMNRDPGRVSLPYSVSGSPKRVFCNTYRVPITVWVEDWQMQCCGEPFSIGSTVRWNLVEPDLEWLSETLGPELASHVTYGEEHHGREGRLATGVIRSIRAVHYQTAPRPDGPPNHHYPVSGSARLHMVTAADGWDQPFEGVPFHGYLVDLDVVAS